MNTDRRDRQERSTQASIPRTLTFRLLHHHHHHHRGPRQPHTFSAFALLVLYWASKLLARKIQAKASVGVFYHRGNLRYPFNFFWSFGRNVEIKISIIHTVNREAKEKLPSHLLLLQHPCLSFSLPLFQITRSLLVAHSTAWLPSSQTCPYTLSKALTFLIFSFRIVDGFEVEAG